MENLFKNRTDLYDFRNNIINEIEKEIGETEETEETEKLRLHRPEEKLINLIKNIENDNDLDKDNTIKSKKKASFKYFK